jgi:hypothetical protein
VWNEYVKTGKVKGFSIEGYFADKMERPQDNTTGLSEQEADLLLSQITSIVKGEQVELALELGGFKQYANTIKAKFDSYQKKFNVLDSMVRDVREEAEKLDDLYKKFQKEMDAQEKEGEKQAKALGIKFVDTPIGKEWERIAGDILTGKYTAYKRGLVIDISR